MTAPAEPPDRDGLIAEHLVLADRMAARLGGRPDERDDLRQVARLGLVKAARRFDPARGHDFAAFAAATVSGELKRYLRDEVWTVRPPRRVQELHVAARRLEQTKRGDRSRRAVAGELGVTERELDEALACGEFRHPLSLDAPTRDDPSTVLGDALAARSPSRVDPGEADQIARVCRRLPARDRRMLYLRFFEERTQQEIAEDLGMSQMQVSRSLRRILERLRSALEAGEPSAPVAAPEPMRPRRVPERPTLPVRRAEVA